MFIDCRQPLKLLKREKSDDSSFRTSLSRSLRVSQRAGQQFMRSPSSSLSNKSKCKYTLLLPLSKSILTHSPSRSSPSLNLAPERACFAIAFFALRTIVFKIMNFANKLQATGLVHAILPRDEFRAAVLLGRPSGMTDLAQLIPISVFALVHVHVVVAHRLSLSVD